MGLTDKLKDIRKQAQGVVADHKDDLQNAVGTVGSKADEKTHGKYADRIARVGDKLNATVDKLAGSEGEGEASAEAAAGGATEASAEAAEAAPTESDAASDDKTAGEPPQFA